MLCKNPFEGFGCGQCIPCRINLRRTWTHRIMLEASLHQSNGFLTLTYDEQNIPAGNSLDPKHCQHWLKRFRAAGRGRQVRYYLVGEYGDESQRPHYHAALFGFGCLGKIQRIETGIRCYCEHCELVRSTWGYGNIDLDELNDTTAAYIGGYVLKKMTSKDDPRLKGRHPEFSRSSRRPGLARDAVPVIAEALKSEYGHLAFQHGDVPPALYHGTSKAPLGRYLKTKLREELGLEKINPETGEVTYGAPHSTISTLKLLASPEVHSLQDDLRRAPRFSPQAQKIYSQIDQQRSRDVSTRKQRVLNMETKHAIKTSGKVKKI